MNSDVRKGIVIGILICVILFLGWSKLATAVWIAEVQGEGEELRPMTVEEMNASGRR